jgi:hypothetical protein
MLGASKQLWKLYFSLCFVILGGFVLAFAVSSMERLTDGFLFVLVFGGLFVVSISVLAGGLSIKCPKCGAKLFWRALKEAPASQWLQWLLTLSRCPACEHDPNAPKGHHEPSHLS